MKIVCCDNFARDTVDNRLVAENIHNRGEAEVMLAALTATCHDADLY